MSTYVDYVFAFVPWGKRKANRLNKRLKGDRQYAIGDVQ